MKILFLGDSITDCAKNAAAGSTLPIGQSYVMLTAARLGADNLGKYEFVNQGISGNRIVDVYARIKRDCWNHQPDLISILIGVNDVWHEINHQNGVEADRFEKMYDALLSDTRAKLPNVKFMLLEPFVLPGGATNAHWEEFRAETAIRGEIVERLAKKYDAVYIPLQERLDKAAGEHPEWITPDGVHPSPAGHQIIADAWLAAFPG